MSATEKLKTIIAEIDALRMKLWGNGLRPKGMTTFQLRAFKKLSKAKISIKAIG